MIDWEFEKRYTKAIRYCLGICIKKRYTEFLMAEKINKFLSKDSLSQNEIDNLKEKLLARLKELSYIDDLQYAKDFISEKTRIQLKGKFKIRLELMQKHISKELINLAFESTEINEEDLLSKLLQKKIQTWQTLPKFKQREKAQRFLSSRGFSLDSIYKCLDIHYSNTEDKD